jgi:hemoglobin
VRLRAGHFERWLVLWRATVDELFAGERAELAKAHALRVAQAFRRRLQDPAVAADASPAPGGISVTWHGSPLIGKG